MPAQRRGRRQSDLDDDTTDVAGLDHVVIRTSERTVALYSYRLGLDLQLDLVIPALGSRMLFFVGGDLLVEITHDTRIGLGAGAGRISGLAWRDNDIDRGHTRMAGGGVDVSEVRVGRRPGTRVFAVKGHTAVVSTLDKEPRPAARSRCREEIPEGDPGARQSRAAAVGRSLHR